MGYTFDFIVMYVNYIPTKLGEFFLKKEKARADKIPTHFTRLRRYSETDKMTVL